MSLRVEIFFTPIFALMINGSHLDETVASFIRRENHFSKKLVLLITQKTRENGSMRSLITSQDSNVNYKEMVPWIICGEDYRPPQDENEIFFRSQKAGLIIIEGTTNFTKEEIEQWKSNPSWTSRALILIILKNSKNPWKDAQEATTKLWNHALAANTFILTQGDETIFFTWNPYTQPTCHVKVFQITTSDTYITNTTLKLSNPYFTESWKNLQQCKLKAAVGSSEPYIYAYNPGEDYNAGFEYQIFLGFAQKLNFSFEFVEAPPGQSPYIIFTPDGVPTGLVGLVYRYEADFLFQGIRGSWARHQVAEAIDPYTGQDFTWAAPLPPKVAKWKIIFLVFDPITWFLLFVVISTTTILISMLTREGNVKSTLVAFAMVLNTSTTYESKGGLLRIFLAFNFMFILNVTAMYQSILYVLMTDGVHSSVPETADGLVATGHKLLIFPSMKKEMEEDPPTFYQKAKEKNLIVWKEDFYGNLKRVATQEKCACHLSSLKIKQQGLQVFRSRERKPYYRILKERYSPYDTVFFMTKDHPLQPTIKFLQRAFMENGMIQRYIDDVMFTSLMRKDRSEEEELDKMVGYYQVDNPSIEMSQLMSTFMLYIVLIVFSFFLFVGEVLSKFWGREKSPRKPCPRSKIAESEMWEFLR